MLAFYLKLNLKRIDVNKIRLEAYKILFRKIFPFLMILSVILLLVFFSFCSLYNSIYRSFIITIIAGIIKYYIKDRKQPLSVELEKYMKIPKYDEKAGFFNEVEDDLDNVVNVIDSDKIVIFIDDLDRCSPAAVVNIIEAINTFTGSIKDKCMFVLGVDTEYMANCIEITYEKLNSKLNEKLNSKLNNNETKGQPSFGHVFLNKIIQYTLTLPKLENAQLTAYFNKLVNKDQDFIKSKVILADSKEQEEASANFTIDDPIVNESIEMVLRYLYKNPRHVKRFINHFRMEVFLTIRQGIIPDNNGIRKIAKSLLIKLQYPLFYEYAMSNQSKLFAIETQVHDQELWTKLLSSMPAEIKDYLDNTLVNILKEFPFLSSENQYY